MGAYSSKSKNNVPEQSQPPQQQLPPRKKIEITSIDRAILDLKNARDKLQRYRTKLLLEDEKLMEKVRQAKLQNKTSYALQLLKLHHYKMHQYEQCNTQLINILQMVSTIDSTQNDIHIINALKVGKDTLQQLHNEISIDHLVELMEDIAEQNETEQEISNIIQQNIPNIMSTETKETDDELLAELELLSGITTSTTTTTTTTDTKLPELPTVPTHKLPELPTTTTTTSTTSTPEEGEGRVAVLG